MTQRGSDTRAPRSSSDGDDLDGPVPRYGTRFGLINVDFDRLERTPKLSAKWFRAAAQQNTVV